MSNTDDENAAEIGRLLSIRRLSDAKERDLLHFSRKQRIARKPCRAWEPTDLTPTQNRTAEPAGLFVAKTRHLRPNEAGEH